MAGARVQDVVALAHARRAEGPAARRDPGQDPAVSRARSGSGATPPGPGEAPGPGPSCTPRARARGGSPTPPAPPPCGRPRSPCRCRPGRGPLLPSRAWTVNPSGSSSRRSSPEPIAASKAPPVSAVDVPRDLQALHRPRAHPGRLPRGQVIDARDVAVLDEPAQLLLEAVDEVEGGLRGLGGVARVGVRAVDLEHRGHGRVREAVRAAPGRGFAQAEGGAAVVSLRHSEEPVRKSSQSVAAA